MVVRMPNIGFEIIILEYDLLILHRCLFSFLTSRTRGATSLEYVPVEHCFVIYELYYHVGLELVICLTSYFLFQTNEVNQGDALEHNFSAIYGALTLPVNHIFSAQTFPTVRIYNDCVMIFRLSENSAIIYS